MRNFIQVLNFVHLDQLLRRNIFKFRASFEVVEHSFDRIFLFFENLLCLLFVDSIETIHCFFDFFDLDRWKFDLFESFEIDGQVFITDNDDIVSGILLADEFDFSERHIVLSVDEKDFGSFLAIDS